MNVLDSISKSETGLSSAISVPKGEYWGRITSDSWGEATIQVNDRDASGPWVDVFTYTEDSYFFLAGNLAYRMNIVSVDDPIELEIVESNPAADSAISAYLNNNPPIINTPVTQKGEIPGPLVVGDKYFASVGRQFEWIFSPMDFSVGSASALFGAKRILTPQGTSVTVTTESPDQFSVAGTVEAINSGAQWRLRFDVDLGGLIPGTYGWAVAIVGPSNEKVTRQFGQVNVIESYTALISEIED